MTEFKLNQYRYNDIKALRAAFKNLQRLEQQAIYTNDEAALIIMTDLNLILKDNRSILTPPQMEAVRMVLIDDLTEAAAALKLGISQQSVHYRLKGAINRLREYLSQGKVRRDNRLDQSKYDRLIVLFNTGASDKEIAIDLNLPLRRVQNKVIVLRKRGKIGKRGDIRNVSK